jgi:hypothetical protein
MEISFPEQIRLGQSMTMSISGIPKNPSDAVVFVSATTFCIEGKRWQSTNRQPIKFELVPWESGLQFIEVELFHGTSRVGYVVIETEVS